MRRAVMLAAAVAAMAPASAQAGTLTVRTIAGQWTELTYVAGPLEANAVQMSYDAKLGRLIFVDAGRR